MATEKKLTNNFLDKLFRGGINLDPTGGGYGIKAVLLDPDYVFSADADDEYDASISTYELSTGNGYTAGGVTLQNVAITRDNDNDKVVLSADDIAWTADGGAIGPIGTCLLHMSDTGKTVIGVIAFGTSVNIPDGMDFLIREPGLETYSVTG